MTLIYTRLANADDLEKIMLIIKEAKQFLRESGSSQWQGEYPNEAVIKEDISHKNGYVLMVDKQVAAYSAAIVGIEPTYASIDGKWKNELDQYATFHRVAISSDYRGMHLSSYLISNLISILVARGIVNFRIDTSRKNQILQHIAKKHGFVKRGIIQVDEDPEDPDRLAYELNLIN